MPGHFDGNAPTVAPTLFGEDLPWLGFHFDTETVMFKKLYEDTPKGPPTKGSTKLMPSKLSIKLPLFQALSSCQISP